MVFVSFDKDGFCNNASSYENKKDAWRLFVKIVQENLLKEFHVASRNETSLCRLELDILRFWDEQRIFEKSVERTHENSLSSTKALPPPTGSRGCTTF